MERILSNFVRSVLYWGKCIEGQDMETNQHKWSISKLWNERNLPDTTGGRLWELFKFCVAGGVGFLIDYGGLLLLREVCGLPVLLANALSFTVSVAVNYVMCAYWVFRTNEKKSPTVMGLFLLTSLIGLGLSELIMWVSVNVLHIHYMIAKIVSVVLVMIWNYFSKRKVLVQKPKDGEAEPKPEE